MRRSLSIFLILLFGFGPLSVLIDSQDANLPPCCRSHGAHHCAMSMRMAEMMREMSPEKRPMVGAPLTCPEYPGFAALFAGPIPALTVSTSVPAVLRLQIRAAVVEYASLESVSTLTRAGRGPPQTQSIE